MPGEEPDQKRFERIAAAYLAGAEVEGLTSIHYVIVSLLVTGSEKALLRHHKNLLNDGRCLKSDCPRPSGSGQGSVIFFI